MDYDAGAILSLWKGKKEMGDLKLAQGEGATSWNWTSSWKILRHEANLWV